MQIRSKTELTFVAGILLICGLAAAAKQMPSPPGTASVDLGGKTVSISYGRPSVRGRTIMGSLVPYGEVWRTGANESTTMTAAGDITIGTLRVPAGKYSLYTLPDKTSWKLIVNKQTGQWGTEYPEGKDLGRVNMQVSKTPSLVEQFTISFAKKGGNAADLVMEWENTRASVAVMAGK